MNITRVELYEYWYEVRDVGMDETGFNLVYVPGNKLRLTGTAIRICTNEGVSGEYVGFSVDYPDASFLPRLIPYLLGKDPLQRERIYTDIKRALRQYSRLGIGPLDIALWDLAGRYHNAPIYQLLGGYRTSIPCYASTYHADNHGGLDSPEAFADFAEACLERGYPAFKIHGWGVPSIQREIETIRAVRERVGNEMDLMLDPACEYRTFADAYKVGLACDENGLLWYEDPFRDGGLSHFAHRKLRQLIRTPLLIGEHVRSLEPRIDFALAEATDFVRGDVLYEGITGTIKLAHAAEALGLDVELHMGGPATRHCLAAIRNSNYYEVGLVHPKAPTFYPPVYLDGYRDDFEAVDSNGCVPVPTGPGLGVAYDWEYIKSHTVGFREFV